MSSLEHKNNPFRGLKPPKQGLLPGFRRDHHFLTRKFYHILKELSMV
nr:MAG TPA: hypothetical protein [Caudoviricetes sp.]